MASTISILDATTVTANARQAGELDDDNVAQMIDAIRAGRELPPVVVVREWMEVVDGCHRLAACRATGTPLRAIVISRDEYQSLRDEGVAECDLTDELC